MLKKIRLLCLFALTPFILAADQTDTSSQIQILEKEIADLKTQLNSKILERDREEEDSQGFMIVDWEAYAKEVKNIKEKQDHAIIIEKQIQELEKRRIQLLKENNS